MKKKFIVAALCLTLLATSFCLFSACKEVENDALTIVYLGDSIAEAIAGPSPLTEREWYGYYALLGRCNGYNYYNRAVSGHRSEQLLGIIQEEDKGATITHSLIKDADIIHISILGNDVLTDDFSGLIIDAAVNNYTRFNSILTHSRENFAGIVETIRELNPDVTLIFQTIYNPGDPTCKLYNEETRATLLNMGFPPSTFRELASRIIIGLNDVIYDYLDAHPNAFYVSDVYASFDEIYNTDSALGNELIFTDWIHPSDFGHAVAAWTNQKLLQDLGLADADQAVAAYKELRSAQVARLFAGSVDVAAVQGAINAAETYEAVTMAYFNAIRGLTPVYC